MLDSLIKRFEDHQKYTEVRIESAKLDYEKRVLVVFHWAMEESKKIVEQYERDKKNLKSL